MPTTEKYSINIDGKDIQMSSTVPTKEENLTSLEEFPLFIACIEYYATGEGMSYIVLASRHSTQAEFEERWAFEYSYYLTGCKIYKNEIPDNSAAYNALVSPSILVAIMDILSGEKDSGNFVLELSFHQNFS